ncbi:MAG: protein kinase, partial [Pseudomonadota bacterium]
MEGSYEILGIIGRSGLGTLYSARFQGEGGFTKLVALKMLDEGVTESDEVACRLRDEARVLGFLKHPAVVRADRLIRLAGRWTLVQEHVEGVDLESILAQGPMPDGPALEVVAAVAGGLHAAYTSPGPDGASLRLQHRDIKPATILVDTYGAPHVIDFGIARAFFSGREAHTRSFVVGSFEYMAPERLALEEGGPWSDIYSLGQVLFALLMGHGFGRSHPSERHHKVILDRVAEQLLARPGGVDEELLGLLGRMLSLEPHERPDARSVERTCHEIARRLGQETLRAWAERVVEPMVQRRTAAPRGGFVGRRLSEGEAAVPRPVGPPLTDPGLVGPRAAVRGGLEPLPVAVSAAGEDEATEIMSLAPATGRLQRGVPPPAEVEATEALDDPGAPARPAAGSAEPEVAPEPAPDFAESGGDEGAGHLGPGTPLAAEEPLGGPDLEERPTTVEDDLGADRPTTIGSWEAQGLGESFAEGALDEVTAVTDFASLDPFTMDHEGPTVRRHGADAAEPTEALDEERPPGEVARFDPSRIQPVQVEEEPEIAPSLPLFDEETAVGLSPEPDSPPPPARPARAFDEATVAEA